MKKLSNYLLIVLSLSPFLFLNYSNGQTWTAMGSGMTNGNETILEIANLSCGMYFIRVGKDAEIFCATRCDHL